MRAQLPAGIAPAEVRHRRLPVDGAELAVVEVGPPAAPSWIVAHGAGSSARFVVEALAAPVLATGRRLITYDLRGHGASSPARSVAEHHLDVHADDLAEVVASGDDDIEVVGGISLGAHAAVRAVSEGVHCAVVLGCLPAWIGRAIPGDGPHAAIAGRLASGGIASHLAAIEDDPVLPAWLRRTLLADQPRHDPASLEAVLTSLDGGLAPTVEELTVLPAALAVVGWPDDPGHPLEVAQRWAASGPRGHLEVGALEGMAEGTDHLGRCAVAAVTEVRS